MENGIEFNTSLEKLRECMTYSIVRFSYKKTNGEVRDAMGTLNSKLIEERGGSLPNGTGKAPTDTFPYWDVNSEGWRSFRRENFVWADIDAVEMNGLFD